MSKSKATYSLLFCLLMLLAAASACQPDESWDDAAGTQGEATISLTIPTQPSAATRAEADITADEGHISSLWFLAYPTAGSKGKAVTKQLPATELTTTAYQTYQLTMKPGTYRFYVVANAPQLYAGISEEALKAIVLKYKEDDAVTLPTPTGTGIPMTCLPTEIKITEGNATNTNGEVTLENQKSYTLTADLRFSCVKVQYTLVFDNTLESGCSNANFGKNKVKLTDITVDKIALEAPLLLMGEQPSRPADGKISMTSDEAGTLTQTDGFNHWSFTGILYLPEHLVTETGQQTELKINAVLLTPEDVERSKLTYTIHLGGEDDTVDPKKVNQLKRGTYYDINAKIAGLGNEVEATAAVQDWTLQSLNASLDGPFFLHVDKTSISLASGQEVTVPCQTDAPLLSWGSMTLNGDDGKPFNVFDITLNKDELTGEYTSFTAKLSSGINPSNAASIKDGYFYIIAQDKDMGHMLWKKILVDPISVEPYLKVTPPQHTVYIKELANTAEHTVSFEYETNLDEVSVTWTNVNTSLIIANSGLNKDTHKGIITCTLKNPHVISNFPETEKILFNYTATSTPDETTYQLTEQTTLTIIPNAGSYRLHFRPIDDSWTNPHIYVYEPLYTPDGIPVLIKIGTAYDGENALLYSFTGKRTFEGWQSQGGKAPYPSWDIQGTDHYWHELNTLDSYYNKDIDYCPDFGSDCSSCQVGKAPKWPGVRMKKDTDNPGWFYFDLPLLAKPGKALIMFAEGHLGSTSDAIDKRYPAHMVPGMPLYNFADKDGWFLYDWNQSVHEFVDDKPNVLPAGLTRLPNGTYRIWTKTTYTHIHIWEKNDENYTQWDDDSGILTQGDGAYKYFDMTIDSNHNMLYLRYMFHTGDDKSGETDLAPARWTKVTGKDYDYEVYL